MWAKRDYRGNGQLLSDTLTRVYRHDEVGFCAWGICLCHVGEVMVDGVEVKAFQACL
ncbi:hypothetical protein [Bartonella capreoli]|uniref:hypothetical protein n=1 Tax=Bartonella capreoli TaxID=155192 RepID=UPI001ABC907B|nr:hypothetical protein [Bartonella capreoli]